MFISAPDFKYKKCSPLQSKIFQMQLLQCPGWSYLQMEVLVLTVAKLINSWVTEPAWKPHTPSLVGGIRPGWCRHWCRWRTSKAEAEGEQQSLGPSHWSRASLLGHWDGHSSHTWHTGDLSWVQVRFSDPEVTVAQMSPVDLLNSHKELLG